MCQIQLKNTKVLLRLIQDIYRTLLSIYATWGYYTDYLLLICLNTEDEQTLRCPFT